MKHLRTLALGAFTLASVVAQETPPPSPEKPVTRPPDFNSRAMVRVDVLMLSVPEEKLLPLLPQLRNPDQIAAAEQTLLTMVANREATLDSWPEVTTYDGARAISESIVEFRYPIEFRSFGQQTCLPTAGSPPPKEPTPEEKAAIAMMAAGQICPISFETRNVGASLEVEPSVSPDGKAVTVALCPRNIRFERFSEFPAGTSANGQKLSVQQPVFNTSSLNTAFTLRDGERRMIYLGKSSEDKRRFDVFIVGAKIFPGVSGKK